MVREALLKAGRVDLIGSGCGCLIPAHTPKAAMESRRRRANEVAEGDRKLVCVHRKGATRAFPPGHPEIPAAYQAITQARAEFESKKSRRVNEEAAPATAEAAAPVAA